MLLITFVLIERRSSHPLLPLHIVLDRARGGAYLSLLLAAAGIFGVFFFLTFFLQLNLHFSPITSGLAFLPLTAVLVLASTTAQTRVLPRTGPKPLVVTGMALGIVGMYLFTRLTPTSTYAANVLPGLLVFGVGLGLIFAPAIGTATLGVEAKDTGVASAVVNVCQQIGGSIGLALLSTIAASAAASYASTHGRVPGVVEAATIHGYTTAFWWALGIFAIGLVAALVVLPSKVRTGKCSVRKALSRGLAYALHLDRAVGTPETDAAPVGAGGGESRIIGIR